MTTMPCDSNVLLERTDGHVRILTLNRPEKRNALNTDLTSRLVSALRQAEADSDIHVVLIEGGGAAFCAGADISEFRDLLPHNASLVEERAALTAELHRMLPGMSKPTVAAVHGPAMGGGAGLALACDMVVMASTATIGYPEVRRGIVPAIVMASLVGQVGRKAAFELVSLGEPISAQRALYLGLATRVVEPEEVGVLAYTLSRQMAGHSRLAMAATKRLFMQVANLPLAEGIEIGREMNIKMRGFLA